MQTGSCFPALGVSAKTNVEPFAKHAIDATYRNDFIDFSKPRRQSRCCRSWETGQKALHYESLSGNFATLFYCNSNHVVFALFV